MPSGMIGESDVRVYGSSVQIDARVKKDKERGELINVDEFICTGSGKLKLSEELLKGLRWARKEAGVPFIINSGYRSPSWNQQVGGSKNSSHLKGYAADIKADNSVNRYAILRALVLAGFQRIGVYEDFIHVDCDPDKSQKVIWYG